MYPDLSYFLHDIFGTARDNWTSIFKTYGLFLVLAIAVAAWLLYLELRRRADEGELKPEEVKRTEGLPATPWELLSNVVYGFIVGFKGLYIVQHIAELQADPAGVILSGKGSWLGGILGVILFTGFKFWEGQKRKLPKPKVKITKVYPHHRIGDITLIAAISGVVGAKVFAIIEDLPGFFADPVATFFSGAGLAIYGGLIGGFVGVSLFLRRKAIPQIPVLDAVAAPLMIAYGIGRLGCHFSGDGDWGIAAAKQPEWWFLPDWLWAYDYPYNVINEGVPLPGCTVDYCMHLVPAVYPTSIYEFLMAVALGLLLWSLRKRLAFIPGVLFSLYLMLNGTERFIIEKIRVNQPYEVLGYSLTQAEIIAIVFFLLGLAVMAFFWQKAKKN